MLTSWLRLKRRVKTSIPENIALDFNNTKFDQKIYQNDAIESPFLFGIIRPRIYIPNSVAEEELPYIVQHEMTHLKRKDYLVKPVGFLLLSVYWFNPFVWAAYVMLCKDIELICDEKVIRQLGASQQCVEPPHDCSVPGSLWRDQREGACEKCVELQKASLLGAGGSSAGLHHRADLLYDAEESGHL